MKKLFFIIILLLAGCGAKEEVLPTEPIEVKETDSSINIKQIEYNFTTATEKYLNGILEYIDEMNIVLNDDEYIEVSMNSLILTSSELFSSSIEQGNSDNEFLLADDIERYNKYELTNEKINEIQDIVSTITTDINDAALDYDETLIVKTRGNVLKLKNLTNEAIKQLRSDSVKTNTTNEETDEPTQDQLDAKLKEEAITLDFVAANGDEIKEDTKVTITGEVTNIANNSSVGGEFTVSVKENDGFGMYTIKNFSMIEVEKGSTVTVYGTYADKDNVGMPSIMATIIE